MSTKNLHENLSISRILVTSPLNKLSSERRQHGYLTKNRHKLKAWLRMLEWRQNIKEYKKRVDEKEL